jgi:hypothetical protein
LNAQALPQPPDAADELNAVAKNLGIAAADIHLGGDASDHGEARAAIRIIRSSIRRMASWRATSMVSASRRWRPAFRNSLPNAMTGC